MRTSDSNSGLFARLTNFLTRAGRESEFTCGDCERWERCGLAPSEDCIVKAAQIERGYWKSKRRLRALSRVIG